MILYSITHVPASTIDHRSVRMRCRYVLVAIDILQATKKGRGMTASESSVYTETGYMHARGNTQRSLKETYYT